jgi:hypothetical protein
MHVWCARCKRVQDVVTPQRRRRRALEALAGRIGVCAVCGYPVSMIGQTTRGIRSALSEPTGGTARWTAASSGTALGT